MKLRKTLKQLRISAEQTRATVFDTSHDVTEIKRQLTPHAAGPIAASFHAGISAMFGGTSGAPTIRQLVEEVHTRVKALPADSTMNRVSERLDDVRVDVKHLQKGVEETIDAPNAPEVDELIRELAGPEVIDTPYLKSHQRTLNYRIQLIMRQLSPRPIGSETGATVQTHTLGSRLNAVQTLVIGTSHSLDSLRETIRQLDHRLSRMASNGLESQQTVTKTLERINSTLETLSARASGENSSAAKERLAVERIAVQTARLADELATLREDIHKRTEQSPSETATLYAILRWVPGSEDMVPGIEELEWKHDDAVSMAAALEDQAPEYSYPVCAIEIPPR